MDPIVTYSKAFRLPLALFPLAANLRGPSGEKESEREKHQAQGRATERCGPGRSVNVVVRQFKPDSH